MQLDWQTSIFLMRLYICRCVYLTSKASPR